MENKVQLITYPDSLGGNIKSLHKVLNDVFPDAFLGGIHLLPPFPSSGDRGFAPIDYYKIEEKFGTWEDVRKLGKEYDVTLDLMVNHVSRKSEFFCDFLKNGKKSKYFDMFITPDKVWLNGQYTQEDIDNIYLRRDLPFSDYFCESDNSTIRVWTTFGKENPSEQIDIDINSEETINFLKDTINFFAENNIKMIRLDAIGFVTKKKGTSCFFLEPDIYNVIEKLKAISLKSNVELLPEVHYNYETNFKLANHGCRAYDFAIPYLILNVLINKSINQFTQYLKNRPNNLITMLDCHDGIPIKPDLDGLFNIEEAKKIVGQLYKYGGSISTVRKKDQIEECGFDVHQMNTTYYSILGSNDDAYIAARALQLFIPGIPQIYYVGLLAGENYLDSEELLVENRAINRYNYSITEIIEESKKDVVKRLVKLIHLRNSVDVFDGSFEMTSINNELVIKWVKNTEEFTVNVDYVSFRVTIRWDNTTISA